MNVMKLTQTPEVKNGNSRHSQWGGDGTHISEESDLGAVDWTANHELSIVRLESLLLLESILWLV
jgi:hypothetical protein